MQLSTFENLIAEIQTASVGILDKLPLSKFKDFSAQVYAAQRSCIFIIYSSYIKYSTEIKTN